MKRFWCVLLVLLSLACNFVMPPTLPPLAVDTATAAPSHTPAPFATPTATLTPSPIPPTATPTPAPTSVPQDPGLELRGVHMFPWPLYAGDWVSVDVDPRLPEDVTGPLTLTWTLDDGAVFTTPVDVVGLDDRLQARFYWAWQVPETTARIPFTFTLLLPPGVFDPDLTDNTLALFIAPLPAEARPAPEPEARWVDTELPGVRLHYLTGSAAERDLEAIAIKVAAAYTDVTAHFGAMDELLDIYLLDRVIGQGGYASSEWVAVSYTDRQYTPINLGMVLRHELTHRLDAAMGCHAAPSVVREGLAVYVAGGHYWAGSLVRDAAALRASKHYIPLAQLAVDFYTQQHEISYREAGAFVSYIIEHYGWEGLETFCRAPMPDEGDAEQWLDTALGVLGEPDWQAFEKTWETWLDAHPAQPKDLPLLEAELRMMETLRAYQRGYDLSAHFLEGILFSPQEGASLNITADFARRPRGAEPVALELLLVMAQDAVRYGAIETAETLLATIDSALANGFPEDGLAADVRTIVAAALAQGYEPYRLRMRLDGSYEVSALVYAAWPAQRVLTAAHVGTAWMVTPLPLSD